MSNERNIDSNRQGRIAALVVAFAMLLWLFMQWLGKEWELSMRTMFLFDLLALAAFFWSLVVAWQLWRKRREN
ncbi:MAG: DUF5337 domain-containing protein [Paracoccaceae bacterium]|nr:DUF5337 domain-containing protein [Paracoccaceae bacterium]